LYVQKNGANNLIITYPNPNLKIPTMLIELSILLRIYWCPIMTIMSIETAIVMKYSFIIKTNI